MTDTQRVAFYKEQLLDPRTKSSFIEQTPTHILFEEAKYPLCDGTPILLDEQHSIFSTEDIFAARNAPQSMQEQDKRVLKNKIRKSLPTLTSDVHQKKRYAQLAQEIKPETVLIIGAGTQHEHYTSLFPHALVITSDVHNQFGVDLIFDAHTIPFKDHSFDLVIAAQVLEHTLKPWVVAAELERVTKKQGTLLIETPFCFPQHGAPYDFFRYTFGGIRSLFRKSIVAAYSIPEGGFSTLAVFQGQLLIELFSSPLLRRMALLVSRFLFFWLKYLDILVKRSPQQFVLPKGFSLTFTHLGVLQTNKKILNDIKRVLTP